jgi:quinolinate synthase
MSTLLPMLTDYEKTQLGERQPLPERYIGLSDEEMDRRITVAKAALGRRLVILGHHYQRDEVIKFADYTGDSYKLSQQVAKHPDADYIVFCGVHFMAESADCLSAPHQQVILPDLAAGCSMSDMADPEQLEIAWMEIHAMLARAGGAGAAGKAGGKNEAVEQSTQLPAQPAMPALRAPVIPVTYINSAAAIKAFVGERGGIVCTSSNAAATLKWAWERGEKILFLPDQHLGRNTAYFRMNVPLEEMVLWDPNEIDGGLTPEDIARARLILWKGHCSVHARFTVRQIEQIRAQHPNVRVIVHPEVPFDVVAAADDSGSTEYIIRQVTSSPPGSVWAVGTEIHLVSRLADQVAPDRTVLSIDQFGCLCSTMFRVSPNHLLWILEGLVDGEVHNRIVVPEEQKHWVRVALDRMLSIS